MAWLRHTDGTCRYCRRGDENLCPASRYTGWDADGGYAQYAVAPAAYVYRLPEGPSDADLAPLLCAGIIGYRALQAAAVPDGGRLGVYGFGGSAHLAAQVAIHRGATVHVVTRAAHAQRLALSLGAASALGRRRRRSRWTPRSSSPRSATWCRRRWRRSTGAARSPSPAST